MKIFLKILFLLVLVASVKAQPITWQRTYGDGNIDYGYSIVQTPDDGFIAVGQKRIQTTTYMFAMRLNKYGDTLWTKTFLANAAFQIEKLSDGNYVIGGYPNDPVIKIDINGNVIWIKYNLGGYIKGSMNTGFYNADGYRIKKYDNDGDSIWSFNYLGFLENETPVDYSIGPDNSTLIIGYNKNSFSDLFILKIDESGKLVLFNRFHSPFGIGLLNNLNDKEFIISGDYYFSAFLAKFDLTGKLIWSRSYDMGYPEYVELLSIIKTNDNGFALAGAYHNGNYNYYMRIIKTDSLGNEQWRNLYGYNDNDYPYCIRQTSDTGYVLIGIRDNFNLGDINIVKTDKTGYANPPVSINSNQEYHIKNYQLFQNFPNPFNPKTVISYELRVTVNIKIKVFDVLGNEVAELVNEKQNAGSYSVEFDGSRFSSGIYFCQLKTNNFISSIRMLLIK